MKPIDDEIDVSAAGPELAEGSAPTDNAAIATAVRASRPGRLGHLELQARALRLSAAIGMGVSVDATGFLKDKIAIVYQRRRRYTIRACFVRVGHLAPDAALSGEHGVLAGVRRYNAGIERLHRLADQLATCGRTGGVTLAPGCALADAHEELSGLDRLLAARQAKHMGCNFVLLDRLCAEVAFFDDCIARLAPIVDEAEAAASAPRRVHIEPQCTRELQARKWFRWPRWITR